MPGGVGELAELSATVTSSSSLPEALVSLVGTEGGGLPVLAPGGRELVGRISHRALQRAVRTGA